MEYFLALECSDLVNKLQNRCSLNDVVSLLVN